jgi:pimeloyl-ACP methyl ester carboxylesterase
MTERTAPEPRVLLLADGRSLEYLVAGPPGAPVLVFHHGTPGAAVAYEPLVDAAAGAGLRTLLYSRPGYGGSSPQPGRSVAAAAADVAALLDELGVGRFVTAGWSGGGPHALATAAVLGDRCAGVAGLASVAPFDAGGLDWVAGMGEDNLVEFGAAIEGRAALESYLAAAAPAFAAVTGETIVAAMSSLLPEADRVAVGGGMGAYLVASFARAFAAGTDGWRDDDLAFVRPWGVDLDAFAVPASLWQGGQDLMVPEGHGRWLGDHLPGAELHIRPDHGHLSLVDHAQEIFAGLAALI